jgi:hypothetical protein
MQKNVVDFKINYKRTLRKYMFSSCNPINNSLINSTIKEGENQ